MQLEKTKRSKVKILAYEENNNIRTITQILITNNLLKNSETYGNK